MKRREGRGGGIYNAGKVLDPSCADSKSDKRGKDKGGGAL
jgi:hypothetical protein